jgi:hypothetical protein
MDYDLDMPGYVRDIARWLESERNRHPCHFENALQGFEIMMGLWRSAAEGGQVSIPLSKGKNEIAMMKEFLRRRKILISSGVNSGPYGFIVK